MKKLKRLCAPLLAGVLALCALPSGAAAATYSDVPASNSAYTYVDRVSAAGIMVGDAGGKFNPAAYVDKFETAKILAIIAGYKYTGRTAAEQAAYDSAYSKWKGFINQYGVKFKKWNATMDREIAYLLEKGILTQSDLDQFVILDADGKTERLRALSRQESAVFVTRVMGKEQAALSATASVKFADDAKISQSARPYVYYLKGLGVFVGDGANNFNPGDGITRAAMAVVIVKTMDIVSPAALPTPAPAATPVPAATDVPSGTYTTVSGQVTKVYEAFMALQITGVDANNTTKIYPVATNAVIKVDGYTKAFKDLAEGMTVTCALSGTDLVTVNAVSPAAGPASSPAASQPAATAPAPTAAPAATPAVAAPPAVGSSVLEGTVAAVETVGGVNSVSIEVRILTPKGTVYSETRVFQVPATCVITRGGAAAAFNTMTKGDIITAEVSGNIAQAINLEEKNRSFTATLVEKKLVTETQTAILAMRDAKGKVSELRVAADTYVYRKNVGNVAWSELRIGDSLDVKTEYDRLLEVYAYGNRTSVDVTVRDIFISNTEQSRVTVAAADGKTALYPLISGMVDPYQLRVGSKYRLSLDSAEVEGVALLQDMTPVYMTGVVTAIGGGRLTVRDSAGNAGVREFTYDSGTAFTDAVSARQTTAASISVNAKVYIASTATQPGYARAVTVLGY